jgi:Ca2+-binding RTX toxin-like protein
MRHIGVAFLGAVTALLASAAGAGAATVRVQQIYDKAAYLGDRIYLDAAPGEANDVTLAQETPATVTVSDRVPLTPGAGCEAVSSLLVRCTVRSDLGSSFYARLGDGDDSLDGSTLAVAFTLLRAGFGDDHLVGPANSTNIFEGGPGNDLMEGGHRDDSFREGVKANGSDVMIGGSPAGPGFSALSDDAVDYKGRRRPIRVRMDGLPNDGEAGERDRIDTSVERVVGGSGGDRMSGGAGDDDLSGGPGLDTLRGGAGNDHLTGDDYTARPKRSDDLILGGLGDDRIEGGVGDDRISGGPGHDSIVTGGGADRVNARDDLLDAVLCGSGRDWIYHDSADFLHADCGHQGKPIPAHVVPLFWADDGARLSLALGCPLRHGLACTADVTLKVAGQSFGPRAFELAPGRYAWLWLPLGSRTADDPNPPLDDGVLTFRQTDSLGRVAVETFSLAEVHRDPTPFSFFLPPVLPFL